MNLIAVIKSTPSRIFITLDATGEEIIILRGFAEGAGLNDLQKLAVAKLKGRQGEFAILTKQEVITLRGMSL